MTIPEAKQLLKRYRVPKNILAHISRVTAICLYLGKKLKQNGVKINLTILKQAALLHDLVKVCDFKNLDPATLNQKVRSADLKFWQNLIRKYNKIGHVEAASSILEALKEYDVARIVRKHKFSCLIDNDPAARPVTWEEKILYYADKRTKHDGIVSIRERIKDLQIRYSKSSHSGKSRKVEQALIKLEQEVCRSVDLKPQDLTDQTVGFYRLY